MVRKSRKRQARPAAAPEPDPEALYDSGEIEYSEDGTISIPVLEEELVVTKRVVVRERIIVRRGVETIRQRVDAELRRERVEIEGLDEQAPG